MKRNKTKKYVEKSIKHTAKVAMNSILIGIVVGGFAWEYYHQASQPIIFQKAEAHEEAPEPREVRIKIDYSGWSEKRIQQEILEHLPAVFLEIARCESGTRQYYAGTDDYVRGMVDEDDTGLFQVNKRYHLKTAERLGIDFTDTMGNILFTKYLYERDGLSPWSASKPCWG
jgi:hypothetical protein